MKRRDFLASVGAALSFPSVLAACSSSSSGSSGGNVTINWWHLNTTDPGKSTFQDLANQYMKAHSSVKINITVLENDAFKTKLNTVLQSGTPINHPHIIHQGHLKFCRVGVVLCKAQHNTHTTEF